MRVFLTGPTGFLGSHLLHDLLQANYSVSVLARDPSKIPPSLHPHIQIFHADLSNPSQLTHFLQNHHAVFHTAAKTGIWGPYHDYFSSNTLATQNLLAAAQTAHVPYFIYTSSPSVVYNGLPLSGVDESQPYGTHFPSPYPATKALAEKSVLAANSSSFHTIALRPHLIVGPHDPHLFPRIIKKAKQRKLFIIGNGLNRVDVTYVKDASRAHLLALLALQSNPSSTSGRPFFISQNDPILLWPWINQFLSNINIPPITKKIPAPLAYALGSLTEFSYRLLSLKNEPPISRFLATELSKDHFFNIHNATSLLNYSPSLSSSSLLSLLSSHFTQ